MIFFFLAWKLATIPKTFKKYPVGQYGMFARYVHSSFQRHGLFRKTQLHSSWFGCQKLSCWIWKCCQSEFWSLDLVVCRFPLERAVARWITTAPLLQFIFTKTKTCLFHFLFTFPDVVDQHRKERNILFTYVTFCKCYH